MLAKEVEEEEEGQTSRGSPVIGKCLHWDLYHTSFFGVEKIVGKRHIPCILKFFQYKFTFNYVVTWAFCILYQHLSVEGYFRVILNRYILTLFIQLIFRQNYFYAETFQHFAGASASNCDSGISDGSPGPQVENECDMWR